MVVQSPRVSRLRRRNDIIFEYSGPDREDADSVLFFKEEVAPVAGKELVGRYHKVLSAHPRRWTAFVFGPTLIENS